MTTVIIFLACLLGGAQASSATVAGIDISGVPATVPDEAIAAWRKELVLREGAAFDEGLEAIDRNLVIRRLQDHGYCDATCTVQHDATGSTIGITYAASPGPRYTIASATFERGLDATNETIVAFMKSHDIAAGQAYRSHDIATFCDEVSDKLGIECRYRVVPHLQEHSMAVIFSKP